MRTRFCRGLPVALVLLALGFPGRAQDPQVAAPATHEELLQALIAHMESAAEILGSIEDEAGIPAARKKLIAMTRRQRDLSRVIQKLGRTTREEDDRLRDKYGQKIDAAGERMSAQGQRLAAIGEAFRATMREIQAQVANE